MNGTESNVDETLSDSRGSFRKTRVIPFCRENTRMTNPERRISDKVMEIGIVSPEAAARGCGDAKSGLVDK